MAEVQNQVVLTVMYYNDNRTEMNILNDVWKNSAEYLSSLLHRAFRRITLIINQQTHYIKFHIKTLKMAPTCFDPKIILRELRCSLLKSF